MGLADYGMYKNIFLILKFSKGFQVVTLGLLHSRNSGSSGILKQLGAADVTISCHIQFVYVVSYTNEIHASILRMSGISQKWLAQICSHDSLSVALR